MKVYRLLSRLYAVNAVILALQVEQEIKEVGTMAGCKGEASNGLYPWEMFNRLHSSLDEAQLQQELNDREALLQSLRGGN